MPRPLFETLTGPGHKPASSLGLALGLALGMALASSSALAQTLQPAPSASHQLRPLTWASRPTAAPAAAPVVASAPAPALRPAVIPRGGYSLTPASHYLPAQPDQARGQGLTPAAAFFTSPAPRPVSATEPSGPVPYDMAASRAQVPTPATPAEPPAADDHDPMAPRRDAPIFRLAGQSEPPPAPVAPQATAVSQSRYYSIHRQYGRQPDPAPRTASAPREALAVDLSSMTASSDLAEPPAPPTLIRNSNGRIQALPDLNDAGL